MDGPCGPGIRLGPVQPRDVDSSLSVDGGAEPAALRIVVEELRWRPSTVAAGGARGRRRERGGRKGGWIPGVVGGAGRVGCGVERGTVRGRRVGARLGTPVTTLAFASPAGAGARLR